MPRLPSGSERVLSGEIDARRVIEALVPLERRCDTGDKTTCSCPNPDHEDRNPSFSLNLATGMWTCFSRCGSGNLGRLLVLAGRARSAAEGWKLAEDVGSNGHVQPNGHTRDNQKRSNSTHRREWNPSMIKRGRQTGPEADDLLARVAGLVRLPPESLTKWQVTICERRCFGGLDGPTVMVVRVPVSLPDGTITGGWDRVLVCEADPELVEDRKRNKRSQPSGSGGGDGGGIWLDRLDRYEDERPDWLLVTAGLTDGLELPPESWRVWLGCVG